MIQGNAMREFPLIFEKDGAGKLCSSLQALGIKA
jgi:hypothetical protein